MKQAVLTHLTFPFIYKQIPVIASKTKKKNGWKKVVNDTDSKNQGAVARRAVKIWTS